MSALVSPTGAEGPYLAALQAAIFKTALATTTFHLFKNDIVPGPGTVFADFVEADFTGYSNQVAPAWSTPVIDPVSGRSQINSGTIFFNQSGTTITNTVYGWWLDDGTTTVYAAGRFDTPLEMDTTGKAIFLDSFIRNSGIDGPDPYED